MKLFLTTAALTATLVSGMAFASDPVIPWATNSGGTESTHIAAMGEDLNGSISRSPTRMKAYGRLIPAAFRLMKPR